MKFYQIKFIITIILFNCISVIYQNVSAQSTLSGTVYYDNTVLSPIDACRVCLLNESDSIIDSTYSNSAGFYTFNNVQSGTYQLHITSDKPWSGGNAVDALLIMQHFAGVALLTGLKLKAADVNISQSVNSIDALQVMKRFTGMQTSFMAGDWIFETDTVTMDGINNYQKDCKGLCIGDLNASTVISPSPCPSIIYSGQIYHGVKIGNQCWMKENLNLGMMVFDDYTGVPHSHCSNNGIIEKYCYDNDPLNCEIWGGLYDWNEMMNYSTLPGNQGICPSGWHIPSDAEMCVLTTYLDNTTACSNWAYSGTNASGKMKEAGFTHWHSPNTGATNESGFTSIASGYRHYNGFCGSILDGAYIWTSSEYSATQGITRNLGLFNANISRFHYLKSYGFTVRCIKN